MTFFNFKDQLKEIEKKAEDMNNTTRDAKKKVVHTGEDGRSDDDEK
jgi:hypothetical protein